MLLQSPRSLLFVVKNPEDTDLEQCIWQYEVKYFNFVEGVLYNGMFKICGLSLFFPCFCNLLRLLYFHNLQKLSAVNVYPWNPSKFQNFKVPSDFSPGLRSLHVYSFDPLSPVWVISWTRYTDKNPYQNIAVWNNYGTYLGTNALFFEKSIFVYWSRYFNMLDLCLFMLFFEIKFKCFAIKRNTQFARAYFQLHFERILNSRYSPQLHLSMKPFAIEFRGLSVSQGVFLYIFKCLNQNFLT